MRHLAYDERAFRENDPMAVFYVVRDPRFHVIALLKACGIKFRDEPRNDCSIGRKIDRVRRGLGRSAFLRRSAEWELKQE